MDGSALLDRGAIREIFSRWLCSPTIDSTKKGSYWAQNETKLWLGRRIGSVVVLLDCFDCTYRD
jgi:hypothetical protein